MLYYNQYNTIHHVACPAPHLLTGYDMRQQRRVAALPPVTHGKRCLFFLIACYPEIRMPAERVNRRVKHLVFRGDTWPPFEHTGTNVGLSANQRAMKQRKPSAERQTYKYISTH